MELGPSGGSIRTIVLLLEGGRAKWFWSQEPDQSKEAIRC